MKMSTSLSTFFPNSPLLLARLPSYCLSYIRFGAKMGYFILLAIGLLPVVVANLMVSYYGTSALCTVYNLRHDPFVGLSGYGWT